MTAAAKETTVIAGARPKDGWLCRGCGYREHKTVVERAWDWLYRCPSCGAYDWLPEPEKVPEGSVIHPDEARLPGTLP